MATEIEAKFRVDSHERLRERLQSIGATCLGRVLETNHILDRADGSLRQNGCGLRVRGTVADDDGQRCATMTFKGPVQASAFKSREEIEFDVGDPAAALMLVQRLGFVEILAYEKRRECWQLDDCRIELDEPPHIGLFVEIEGPDETAIARVQGILKLPQSSLVAASYVRMLSEYCERSGHASRKLALPAL